MTPDTPHHRSRDAQAGTALLVGAVLCLVGVGGILWWRYGGVIFNDLVTSALAWCF